MNDIISHLLPKDDIHLVMSSGKANKHIIFALINKKIKKVTFWKGDGDLIRIPFSSFPLELNFNSIEITDFGMSVSIDNKEYSTFSILKYTEQELRAIYNNNAPHTDVLKFRKWLDNE